MLISTSPTPRVLLTDKEGSPRRSRETSAEALIRAAGKDRMKETSRSIHSKKAARERERERFSGRQFPTVFIILA